MRILFSSSAVWVDEDDTGTYTLKIMDDPRTLNKTVYIRPPQNILSQKELVEKWEQLSGNTLKKTYISAEDFLAGMEGINIIFYISLFLPYSDYSLADIV